MGQTSESGHPQSMLSSWRTFMAFYGPGVKRGVTIPDAERPDVAVMTNYFLGLLPLRGHLDPNVPKNLGRVSGVFLENILEGGPADVTTSSDDRTLSGPTCRAAISTSITGMR